MPRGKGKKTVFRMSLCHPERRHWAHDLCVPCYNKRYRADKIEHYNELVRLWNKKHPERRKAIRQKWAQSNVEQMKECRKKWRETHRDAEAAMKHRRRAKLLNAGGSYTAEEWQAMKDRYSGRCVACLRTEAQLAPLGLRLVPDHVLPLAKGGTNDIANIQPLCHNNKCKNVAGCNEYKNDSHIDYREVIGM